MNRIRFVTGVVFLLIGLIVLGKSLSDYGQWNLNKTIGWGYPDHSVLRWPGIICIITGIVMILISVIKRSRPDSKR